MTAPSFTSLPLSPDFLANLDSLGYHAMTPVQAQSLPVIIRGGDIRAQAKTGSGKTAAFGIGILHNIRPEDFHPQALVICPTRELADQVSKEIRRLARAIPNIKVLTLCGGTPMGPQFGSLEHPPHIVVGTPGRLLKHCEKGRLKLDRVNTLVLDEADRMLDMGFLDDIASIITRLPKQRQTLLFSATYPPEIEHISSTVQQAPVNITVQSVHDTAVITQRFFEVDKGAKPAALKVLLRQYRPASAVVFCNRKQQCQEVTDELREAGFYARALHGDMEQRERDQVLVQFANGSLSVLTATDVAARGLDIKELACVVNYELSPDPDIYIHRIGRTGRAGSEGLALNLFQASEVRKVNAIEAALKQKPVFEELPPAQDAGNERPVMKPAMVTLCLSLGKKNKMRPGDILGALTAGGKLQGSDIGKIDIFDFVSYVAVKRPSARTAQELLNKGMIKKMKVLARRV